MLKPGFATPWRSIMNIFVMALGEIEYTDNFLAESCDSSSEQKPKITNPFAVDTSILLAIFLFLVSIVLMNLMVSVTLLLITTFLLVSHYSRPTTYGHMLNFIVCSAYT